MGRVWSLCLNGHLCLSGIWNAFRSDQQTLYRHEYKETGLCAQKIKTTFLVIVHTFGSWESLSMRLSEAKENFHSDLL